MKNIIEYFTLKIIKYYLNFRAKNLDFGPKLNIEKFCRAKMKVFSKV